ncbi:MAG: hypothetical protein JW922_07785, partial [Paludibacteraceae bacterium]|nr:hypothetical protein [Paludibacteraceae bacterium]
MKKNTIFFVILSLLLFSINVFSQDYSSKSSFRGAFGSISALDNSYCEDEINDDIVPDVWKSACTDVVWKVSVDSYLNPDNPTWYTISGTGKTTVLHFIPDSVPSIYFGHPIVFTYEQSSGPILLESASDYTYVYKIPTIYNFGNDTVICPGETAALHLNGSETDIKYILQKDGIDYDSIVGNGSSLIFTPNVAGKYTVIAKHISDVACSRTMLGDADVSFYPPNTPTITGETSLCIDEATNITYTTEAGMTNYEWVVSAGGIITSGSTTNQIIVDWSTAGPKTVTVNYENLNGCRALTPTSQTVNVYEKPVPVITGPSDVCINSVRNFSTASGMSEYVWTVTSGGNITSGSTTNSITIDWTTLGSQDVSVTYKDTHGCVPLTPTIKPVTVNERPIPTITGAQNLCEGTSGMTYTTESGMSAYVWNIPSGGTITSGAGTNQVTVTWNTAGSRTITVNYNNSAGCNALTPSVLNVTVNPLPLPTIAGDDSICLNAELNSIYTTESGMNSYVWSVSAGGAINSGQGTDEIDVTWSTLGAKTINLTYKNEYGCSPINPVTFNATVYPLPVPTITGSDTVCAGVPNVTYTTQTSKLNYDWQVSPGGTITSGAGTYQIKVTWNNLGDNWVSVNYENPTSCAALNPVVKNVYAKEEPLPTIVGPTSFCLDTTSVKTYTTESAQSLYNWVVSAGGVIQSGSGTNQIKVKWYTTGAKTVSVNYTNSGGCSAATPTIIPVNVNPLPVPTISGLAVVCAGVTGITYTTEAGMTSYNWSVSAGGTITAGSGTNEITVSWNTSGAKTVSVNYSNEFGCTAKTSSVLNVTVNPAPTPTISGDAIRCVGATGVVYSTQPGYFNYTWVVSGGTITNGTGTNSIQVTWNTIGNQSVSINYENASGCYAATPTIKPVEVLAIPVPVIIGSDSICVGSTSIYSTEDGMSAYNWSVSAGGSIIAGSGTDSITVQWNTAGSQTVSVNYTNPGNCQAATPTEITVDVNPLPVPTIVGTTPVCVNTTGVVYTTEAGMTDYNWTINGGTITTGLGTNQITVTWTATGAKYVRVNYKNAFGCSAVTPTQYNVTVNTRPNPTINGNDTVCLGATNVLYTTEAGQSDYAWTISAGGTITSGLGTNTILVSWNVIGDQTVSVNYKNASACSALTDKVLNVFVLTEPVPTITGPDPACVGNATYRTEAGMTAYTWNVSAGGSITAGATTRQISVKWNNDGPQTVSVNYTNAGGCSALTPTVKNVTVNPSPTPTIIGDNLVCADGANEIYTTESGMDTYTWGVSSGGVITSGAGTNQVTIAWSTGGAKIVTVNYLNAFSCSASTPTQYNVTVKPLPVPIITGKSTVCVGDINEVYTTEVGMSSYDWQISAGGTITGGLGTNSITVTWNNVGPQQVSVNYINGDNCTASLPTIMNVDVQDLPVPTINGSNGGCLGSVTTYSTEAGMNTYVWNTSAGGTIVGGAGTNEISVLWNTAGPQTVEVNYITPIGCEPIIPTVKNIVVTTLPIPTISGDNSVCEGVPGNVYSTETGMTNYTWTVSAGGTITSGLGTDQIEVSWNDDGNQTVAVNYQDVNGCTALNPFEYNVNVKTAPVPTISGSNSVCKGSTGITYTTEAGMSNYLWSVSAGGTITSGIGTNLIEVSWNTQGNQSVSVNYTAVNGCSAVNETTYPVIIKYVEALINASSLTVCEADTVTFTASSNGGLGATNYDFYVVSNGATPIQSGVTATYKTSTLNNGDQVYVKITDANGCEDYSDTITITVNPLPSVNLAITSAKGNTICIGETVNFQASAGMVNYWYYINGAEINNGPNRNYSTSTLNNNDEIYVKAQSTFGCYAVSDSIIKMSVATVPVASITANPGTSIIQDSLVEFTASAGVDYQF